MSTGCLIIIFLLMVIEGVRIAGREIQERKGGKRIKHFNGRCKW